MDLEILLIFKVPAIKANGETANTVDKENIPTTMEVFMKVSGWII